MCPKLPPTYSLVLALAWLTLGARVPTQYFIILNITKTPAFYIQYSILQSYYYSTVLCTVQYTVQYCTPTLHGIVLTYK
jgi:hypothetical protein